MSKKLTLDKNAINEHRIRILKIINYICTNNYQKVKITNNAKKLKFYRLLRKVYSYLLLFLIFMSFVFIAFDISNTSIELSIIIISVEILVLFCLLIDYALWWASFTVRSGAKQVGYLVFPFTLIGIVLILSILPSVWVFAILGDVPKIIEGGSITVSSALLALKALIFLRIGRIMMLLTAFSPFRLLINVFVNQWKTLVYVFLSIIVLIVLFAIIILNAERGYYAEHLAEWGDNPPTNIVTDFWTSLYFTTISMTTIGYGDFVPLSSVARTMVVLMSLIGIAIFAIPSGIIASSFLTNLQKKLSDPKKSNETVATKFIGKKYRDFFFTKEANQAKQDLQVKAEDEPTEMDLIDRNYQLQQEMLNQIKELKSEIVQLKNQQNNNADSKN